MKIGETLRAIDKQLLDNNNLYMGSREITNTLNIANEDPGRIKVIAASTPSGKHEEFYKWCTDAKVTLRPKQEDIDNFRFTGYIKDVNEKGNGWTQIFSPSIVNKKILDINPDTNQTYLEDIKDELSEMRYLQEVMGEFGDEEMGVYSHRILSMAFEKGEKRKHKYFDEYTDEEKAHFFLHRATKILIAAVDWDVSQACPNILCLCYDKMDVDENGEDAPIFKPIFRTDIPRTQFTLDHAVQTLIELDKKFNFDWVALDRGYGDYQLETIKKYGMQHPETGLHIKAQGFHFGSKLDIKDPWTGEDVSVDFKPFMVDHSVRVFERGLIMLTEKDKVLRRQLTSYRIKNFSQNGRPIFTDEDEHSVDTLNLSLLMFSLKYSDLMRTMFKTKLNKAKVDLNIKSEWSDRISNLSSKKDEDIKIIDTIFGKQKTVYSTVSKNKGLFKKSKSYERRCF